MDSSRKKIIIVSVIVALLIGIGLYFYFSKKTPGPSTNPSFPEEGIPLTGFTGTSNGNTSPNGTTFVPGSSAPLPRLYQLHNVPVSGVGFMEDGKGDNHQVFARYVERGLGHIFETPLNTLVENRIVNETRSRIAEVLWGNNGKSVVVRSLNDQRGGGIIKTSILTIGDASLSSPQSTSTETMQNLKRTEEVFLPDYIPFMATSEDATDKLFYLENTANSAIGSLSNFKNIGAISIFSSAFTEWLPQFPNQKLITLTTKPSAEVEGHLFFLDPKTKSVTKILGGINGLTTLTSRDGKTVLFAETINNMPSLFVYTVATSTTTSLILQTLPEKCVWSSQNTALVYCAVPKSLPSVVYPDQWYQGLVTLYDDIWEIDTTTGSTQKIMSPETFNAPMLDIINPTISSDDTYLLFMDKITGTPWVYRIKESAPLLIQKESSSTAIIIPSETTFASSTKEMVQIR